MVIIILIIKDQLQVYCNQNVKLSYSAAKNERNL